MKNLLFFLLLCVAAISCKTQYIPIETTKTVSTKEFVDRVKYDSIYLHDSVNQIVDTAGKVVYKEVFKYKWRDRLQYKDSIIYKDSVMRKDSIIYRDKSLSKWQSIKMETGGIAIGFVLIALVLSILYVLRRFKVL